MVSYLEALSRTSTKNLVLNLWEAAVRATRHHTVNSLQRFLLHAGLKINFRNPLELKRFARFIEAKRAEYGDGLVLHALLAKIKIGETFENATDLSAQIDDALWKMNQWIINQGFPRSFSDALSRFMVDPEYLPTKEEVESFIRFYEYCRNLWANHSIQSRRAHFTGIQGFEILTREYVSNLADYLAKQINLYADDQSPVVILETGAGHGRLTYFLEIELQRRIPASLFQIVAIDSGEDKIEPRFVVEQIDAETALEKYRPTLVICSWMPCGKDFTAAFRKAGAREYVLIGETDFRSCGDAWFTWGYVSPLNEDDYGELKPPYEADGFHRLDLKLPCQMNHGQLLSGETRQTSKTVAFVRH